jgi:GrpB-like predicted nucleotidyltransferase (UPF0157 family)
MNPQATIEIFPYDENWPAQFEKEATVVRQALGANFVAVHHIGSTSVPGLAAKPIIDMLGVVHDITQIDAVALDRLGYENRGELGIAFRRFFQKGVPRRTHHLHIWEEGNPDIDRHLLFRDYLRSRPDDVKRYENLKRELAVKHPDSMVDYIFGKDDLIAEIIDKTGYRGLTMRQALLPVEWEMVRKLHPGIVVEDAQHIYWAFLEGPRVIGACELELAANTTAQIKWMGFERSEYQEHHKSYFVALVDKWLSHEGRRRP